MKQYIQSLEYTNVRGNPAVYAVGYGNPIVLSIQEFAALGDGDRWCWMIEFSDGSTTREFKADRVHFCKVNPDKPDGGGGLE